MGSLGRAIVKILSGNPAARMLVKLEKKCNCYDFLYIKYRAFYCCLYNLDKCVIWCARFGLRFVFHCLESIHQSPSSHRDRLGNQHDWIASLVVVSARI